MPEVIYQGDLPAFTGRNVPIKEIAKVPIADKVLPYYKAWYESCPECEYLLHTEAGKHFEYRNYYGQLFQAIDGTARY